MVCGGPTRIREEGDGCALDVEGGGGGVVVGGGGGGREARVIDAGVCAWGREGEGVGWEGKESSEEEGAEVLK